MGRLIQGRNTARNGASREIHGTTNAGLTTLGRLSGVDSRARAIDRLGRARLVVFEVDQALEYGIAAEIALMHDDGGSNTEIKYKIGSSRAAWLLGQAPDERMVIFEDVRHLYDARSKAVHSGVSPSQRKIELDQADALVTRILRAVLAHGRFPNWLSLTLGGDGAADRAPLE